LAHVVTVLQPVAHVIPVASCALGQPCQEPAPTGLLATMVEQVPEHSSPSVNRITLSGRQDSAASPWVGGVNPSLPVCQYCWAASIEPPSGVFPPAHSSFAGAPAPLSLSTSGRIVFQLFVSIGTRTQPAAATGSQVPTLPQSVLPLAFEYCIRPNSASPVEFKILVSAHLA